VGATEAGRASARIARPRPGIILGVEHYPYGLLTMIVSLEAIEVVPVPVEVEVAVPA
jgi:hypothetical protein